MKKLNFLGLIFLILLSFTAIGCTSQDKSKTEIENNTIETNKNNTDSDNLDIRVNSPRDQAIFEENEEKDNTEIDKRYKEVDKSKLDYNATYSSSTYYETENGFVGSKSGISSLDNKIYKEILKDYTYACEVNPTKVTYKDAIKLAKSVLPDDIKEIRKNYDSSTTKTYLVFSSSQGNFIVGISYDYKESHADGFIPNSDKDIVVGIDYMNEIN